MQTMANWKDEPWYNSEKLTQRQVKQWEFDWMSIKNHPSTLVGYGITDAVSKKNLREIMDGQNKKHTEQDKKIAELDKKIAELERKIP